ncbi:OmpA family protein [Roseofilum sp. BLCC_M91]|uniref:OmpA family protein n=1 Tax=Roseofilum halophilum BLCC-M91 TaxID=3022259 RepID=A0ABT7BNP2_9CYAN|nr:OmpA family protein [Roseofilum halophilum]MDJ1180810.1 OmpA family protein [Roseofilum halophilum BLCC-M91]
MTEVSDSPTPPTPPTPPSQGNLVTFLLVTIFRLLLLGVSSSMAFILGIAIAFFYPDPNPQMPWIERVLQQPFNPLSAQWWQFRPSATAPPVSLQQRQQAREEFNQLRLDFNTWENRLTQLEVQLNQPFPQRPIKTRLNLLEQQLSGHASPKVFMVTLPSDLLFEGDRTTLNPKQSELLDSLIADLRKFPDTTIQINAYTDNLGDTQENLDLSLQQAESVYEYLYAGLGDNYHFLRVGYGETHFLAPNDSDSERQRNRRVEIIIE